MPESEVQTPAQATGTSADTPLTAPVSESLGKTLDKLLLSALADEQPVQESPAPAEAKAPKAEEEETTAETTSEEAPATAEETEDTDLSQEPEETADNSDSEEPAEDLPKGVKKRISKLSAAKRELEAQIAELKAKVEQAATQPTPEAAPAPLPTNPYLHLDTQAKVDQEFAQARRVKRWCEENPDGATVPDPKTGRETEYTAEEIRRIKLNTLDALEEHLPKQLAYVQQRAQIDPQAEQTYNWWKDRSSAEYQQAQKMLQVFPELQKFPDFKMVVGDYIAGAKMRESSYAKQKAGQVNTKAVVKKAQVQPTKPAAAPAPLKESDARAQQAKATMLKRPTTESLAKVIAADYL